MWSVFKARAQLALCGLHLLSKTLFPDLQILQEQPRRVTSPEDGSTRPPWTTTAGRARCLGWPGEFQQEERGSPKDLEAGTLWGGMSSMPTPACLRAAQHIPTHRATQSHAEQGSGLHTCSDTH